MDNVNWLWERQVPGRVGRSVNLQQSLLSMVGSGNTEVKNTLSLFSRTPRQHGGPPCASAFMFSIHQQLFNACLLDTFMSITSDTGQAKRDGQ